jgi:hypothetical protein
MQTAKAELGAREAVTTKKESPWNSFWKVYELNVDGFVTVAIRQDRSCELVTVKRFTNAGAAEKVATRYAVVTVFRRRRQNKIDSLDSGHIKIMRMAA